MKITYIHQYFNTPSMAGSTRSYEIAKALFERGHEVTIITQTNKKSKKRWTLTQEDGIKVYWLSSYYSNNLNFFQRIIVFLKFSFFASIKARQINANLVFASSTPLTVVIPALFAVCKQKARFVLEVRDLWPDIPIAMGYLKNRFLKSVAYRLEFLAYRRADLIVTLSPDMKKGILKLGIPDKKIIVVTNFSDLVAFNRNVAARDTIVNKYSIDPESIIVLYAGTFGHVNGVDYLVQIASRLREMKNLIFFLVGDGRELHKIQKLANELECLNTNLFIVPQVPKSEVVNFFNSSDIAVSTIIEIKELEANSANKFFDGIAAGCCFLINHGGWQAEFLKQNKCGIVLDHNVDNSAEKLKLYLKNKDVVKKYGMNARKAAEIYFEKGKQIDYLIDQITTLR